MRWSRAVTMWPPRSQRLLLLVLLVSCGNSCCQRLTTETQQALEEELLAQKSDASVRRKFSPSDSNPLDSKPPDRSPPDSSPLEHQNVRFFVHKKRTQLPKPSAEGNERLELAAACLQALGRLLQYFEQHSSKLIADGFFGVAMAKGQLQKLLRDVPLPLLPLTQSLDATCARILNVAKPMFDSGLEEQITGLQIILQPEYWSGPPEWRPQLKAVHAAPWPTEATWQRPLLGGTPSEQMSDECIGELLNSLHCNISEACWREETVNPAIGYSLTHRLLYFQIARQQEGCRDAVRTRSGKPLDKLVEHTCSMILGEARDIASHEFPERFRDLLLEQIAVCGVEGFSDFVHPHWISEILAWQHASGCYGLARGKRSESYMGGSCLVHYSAVATAALATSARHLLQAPAVL